MPTKPTDSAEWASDANYPVDGNPYDSTATKDEPAAGRKQRGWEPGKKPPAQEMNWWQNLIYLWTVFLNAIFASDGHLIRAAFTRRYHANSGKLVYVTAPASCEFATDGSFLFQHGTDLFILPLRFDEGEHFTAVTTYGHSGLAGEQVKMKVFKRSGTATGSPTQLGSTQTGTTNSDFALTVSGLSETMSSGANTIYWVEFSVTGFLGAGNSYVTSAITTQDVP